MNTGDEVTVAEAARILGITRYAMAAQVQRGYWPCEKINRKWHIPLEAINEYQERQRLSWLAVRDLVSCEDAARFLRVAPKTICNRVNSGQLSAMKGPDGNYWLHREELVQRKRDMDNGNWTRSPIGCKRCGLIGTLNDMGECAFCEEEREGIPHWYDEEQMSLEVRQGTLAL